MQNGHPVLIQCSPYRTRNYQKILSNDSRTPGRNSRQQPHKYEAQVLTSTLSFDMMLLITNINMATDFVSFRNIHRRKIRVTSCVYEDDPVDTLS